MNLARYLRQKLLEKLCESRAEAKLRRIRVASEAPDSETVGDRPRRVAYLGVDRETELREARWELQRPARNVTDIADAGATARDNDAGRQGAAPPERLQVFINESEHGYKSALY